MFKSTSTFDKLLDRATSLTNLEPDWNAILAICDTIRQNDVQPKYAVNAIKKKLYATNPNVELMALQVLESCVKNCGPTFHSEITNKSFMEELREIVKMSSDSKVRDEILKLIQVWAHAFRNDSSHRAVQDTVNLMKMEGYKFPVVKESEAMFAADSAPEWADGECCNRCRTQFSMVQRKHHCRNCGQIFCHKCSSKLSTIPKYGIEKEVRVCDDCYDKLNKSSTKPDEPNPKKTSSATESSPYTGGKKPETTKSEREIQEEEELQLALALSQSEAESKEREKGRSLSGSISFSSGYGGTTGTQFGQKLSSSPKKLESVLKTPSNSMAIDDPELSRYLNRDYWEQKSMGSQIDGDLSNPVPSAPQQTVNNTTVSHKTIPNDTESKSKAKLENGLDNEMEAFLASLKSAIEIFVNRINSNQLRGRPIANDSAVQSLFMNITNMHSNLLSFIQQQDDSRAHFEGLQDKLAQIRDARAALDALREEHREQMRREAEEAERLRQQQMAQKLEIMRKKKQEYLQYQREIALQRMQEQEREMLMRQEQQKYAQVWPHSQPIPQGMYGQNGPPTGPPNYAPYAAPAGGQPQTPPTRHSYAASVGHTSPMPGYAPQQAPQYASPAQPPVPQHPPVQQLPPQPPQQHQQQYAPHPGSAPPQQNMNVYDMHSMSNTLPQMAHPSPHPNPHPNPTAVGGPMTMTMNGPHPQPNVAPHIQNANPVVQVAEEPLISFD